MVHGIEWSRDRWRHVTLKDQGHDPRKWLWLIVLKMAVITDLVPTEHLQDRIGQGLTYPQTQYRLSGRQFYRSKDTTNSKKYWRKIVGQLIQFTRRFPPCNKWTSKKTENPITVGRAQRNEAPHSSLAFTSPVQSVQQSMLHDTSYTGLVLLYPPCTKPTSLMKCG